MRRPKALCVKNENTPIGGIFFARIMRSYGTKCCACALCVYVRPFGPVEFAVQCNASPISLGSCVCVCVVRISYAQDSPSRGYLELIGYAVLCYARTKFLGDGRSVMLVRTRPHIPSPMYSSVV